MHAASTIRYGVTRLTRAKVVIHTYLKQQFLRRETVVVHEEEFDTQELVLVRKA